MRHDYRQPPQDAFGKPGTSYPTPNPQDILVVEEFAQRRETYQPLEFGTKHPAASLSTALLVSQGTVKGDDTDFMVRRVYATDRIAQEAYNWSIGYSCDGKAFPKIVRKKLVLRSQYTKLAEYAADPDFATALLVSEETIRADADLDSLFIWVTYVYETLPGPWVPFTRYDNDLGPIQGRKRHVRNTGQASSLALGGSLDYAAIEEGGGEASSLVAWEKEENWTTGAGDGANPAFPINYSSEYDTEKGAVQHKYQLVTMPATTSATLTASGGGIVETSFKDFNNFLQKRDTASYALPGPIIQSEPYDDEKGATVVQTQLVLKANQGATLTLSGSTVTEVEYDRVNTLVYRKKTTTFTAPGPLLTRYTYDAETGHEVTTTTQIIVKPTNSSGYGETAGQTVEYRSQNAVYGLKVVTTFDTTSNFSRTEIREQPYSYPGLLFNITGSLLEAKNGIARVILNATRRTPRTRIVSHSVLITYGQESSLAPPAVFDPVLASLIYDGAFFNVNERNVLNDAISLSYTTGSDNPIWPTVVESVSFAASPLSATDYANMIGTYQIVNIIKEKWKYGLWRMSVISVPLA